MSPTRYRTALLRCVVDSGVEPGSTVLPGHAIRLRGELPDLRYLLIVVVSSPVVGGGDPELLRQRRGHRRPRRPVVDERHTLVRLGVDHLRVADEPRPPAVAQPVRWEPLHLPAQLDPDVLGLLVPPRAVP